MLMCVKRWLPLLKFLSHSLRSYHNMSPPDLWKWKWSNGVGKSEMSIFWCISITNNVKSNKKFNETAQTANFTYFPLILYAKLCKRKRWNGWSKSLLLENKVVINFDFRSGAKKSGHLDYPFQSYGPIMHKTCGEVLLKKTNTFIILQIEAWNEYQMGPVGLGRGDINFKPQFAVWRKC